MGVSVVVVGASLGGLSALRLLLSGLPRPRELRTPIVIVQHRGKGDDVLAGLLDSQTPWPVSEPNDKEPLEAGHVYIAPADYHLLLEPGMIFALSTEAPVNHARPSIDVLFESAALAYGSGVVGVILTGANEDGARGCARIKDRGGVVLVQDPESAEAGAMPAAAIAATKVDRVLPLSELAAALCDLCPDGGTVGDRDG